MAEPIGWQEAKAIGGNQGNAVSIAPYDRRRLLGVRRWPVATQKPNILELIISLWRGLFK